MPFIPVDTEWIQAGMPVRMPAALALTLPSPFGLSQPPRRKPLVFLIRDGDHDWTTHDPDGSVREIDIMSWLFAYVKPQGRIMLFSSPLRRAINTSLGLFSAVFKTNPDARLRLLPYACEIVTGAAADVGSPRKVLEQQYGNKVNAESLGEEWFKEERIAKATLQNSFWRAREVRRFLRDAPPEIDAVVLVSHGAFLKYLTDNGPSTDWEAHELRVYTFRDTESASQEAHLEEHPGSYSIRKTVFERLAAHRRWATEEAIQRLQAGQLRFQFQ
ncbi:hypothetical protein ATEIFO6365_0002045100 [Aspergillus terreus]|uniref:Uncharacterized protein n=1 Tax=Aspergillus terreus TaxID=33178 RepID=A0A5M3YUH2_ASPTE|nr:hypothetical protein ATETN484_0004045100 [Aspergillus terreus]GFF13340.1 hypothetical protein ATEIFO6365_0002045100 [Aspergillus terreus]